MVKSEKGSVFFFFSLSCSNLPINIVHGERLDAIFAQDDLLTLVDVAKANVDKLPRAQHVILIQPPKRLLIFILS